MTSSPPNLALIYADDKTDWVNVGTRVSPDHERLIEQAAEKLGLKKTHFIAIALIERAQVVVGTPEAA